MSSELVTDEMRKQLCERLERLKAENPNAAVVEAWWDGDSLFTSNPKIKTRVVAKGEEHMKSLSKLHQEAIIKAQNETDQNKAAAMAMIEKPIEMIKAIMLKHEMAVIEVMRELHESREAAVRAENEACAKLCESSDIKGGEVFAAKIRARRNT